MKMKTFYYSNVECALYNINIMLTILLIHNNTLGQQKADFYFELPPKGCHILINLLISSN